VKPLIVVFVADLMFQLRIESTIENLGYRVKLVENAEQMIPQDMDALPVLGVDGVLVDQLARLGPSLMIFDLGNDRIPWAEWIPIIKTVPATRRIPVICFGSHVAIDTLKKARATGADEVLARSRFVSAMPELIQKHLRHTDAELLAQTCAQPLHPRAVLGLELFNLGEYFPAHEELEEAWKEDLSPGRDLYRGLLQVAVAYYQISRGSFKGALKMFQRCRQWLDLLPDSCRGVDVAQFRVDAYKVHDEILSLGPDKVKKFDTETLKPVLWEKIER
jgi:CheY-like chemotaxis protein